MPPDWIRREARLKEFFFERRVLIAVGILALAFTLFLLLWYAYQVMLVTFAGLLLAVFLHGVGVFIQQKLGLGYSLSLALVLLAGLLILAGLFVLIAPTLGEQVDEITTEVPKAWQEIRQSLQKTNLGRLVLREGQEAIPRQREIWSTLAGAFSTTLGAIGNLLIILFIGVYLAANPGAYMRGLCALIPRHRQKRFTSVVNEIGNSLWSWVLGRLFAMGVITILTLVGLWLIGVRLALALSLSAGVLNFIPYIGPLASAIPALLIAIPQGLKTVVWVGVLYSAIQGIESYLLTPMVDKRAVSLPPALTITTQVLFGSVAGILGLALATPMTAVAVILVERLYVEDALGKAKDEERKDEG
ncbi:MAG: AI-2E family transporter [Acidobacteria bacterium]|nr:MAG: AI-2E family transporter [Acidobacteriota bacterium]